jgi:2-oxoglutarate dehydrogenase E1 component
MPARRSRIWPGGEFQRVIGEIDDLDAEEGQARRSCAVARSITMLVNARRERKINDIAIVRLEQLYPFPKDHLEKELAKYPKATEIVWCQEEPRNQGAWYWIASRHHLDSQISGKQKMLLVSRPASSSPAVGYLAKHNEQQKALIESALGKIEY